MGKAITEKRYKIPNLSKNFLDKHNFRYCGFISNDEDGHFYRLDFPCFRYLDYVTLTAEITVNIDTNEAMIDVLDQARARYAPAYYYYFGNYEPLNKEIETAINKYIIKLGMIEIKNEDNTSDGRDLFDLPKRSGNKRGRSKRNKSVLPSEG